MEEMLAVAEAEEDALPAGHRPLVPTGNATSYMPPTAQQAHATGQGLLRYENG